ncbi:MAG: hypothetical protein M1812_004129 [Candelaria pacifica]|nr:MAG: hypothetical protein M1812_004129 [Candelaria pacifica]
MVVLVGLPNELLLEVLGMLPKSDLKSIRLACKQLEALANPHLFRRVHMAPNDKALRRFESVYQHLLLKSYVREIVYEAAHYDECYAGDMEYYGHMQSRLLHHDSPEDGFEILQFTERDVLNRLDSYYRTVDAKSLHSSITLNSLSREGHKVYRQHYEEQANILQSGKIASMLAQGLASMQNVKRITITDGILQDNGTATALPGFAIESNGLPVIERESWPGYIMPADEASGGEKVNGFAAILEAIGMTTNQSVQELCITPVNSHTGIPYSTIELLAQDNVCLANVRKGVVNLHRLEIRICQDSDANYEDPEEEFDSGAIVLKLLSELLGAAQELRALALCPNSFISLGSILEVRHAKCWPHLTELELGGIATGASDLTDFLQQHSSTLRHLTLIFIYLEDQGTDWASILEVMRGFLTLKKACIQRLCHQSAMWPNEFSNVLGSGDGAKVERYLLEGGPNPLRTTTAG